MSPSPPSLSPAPSVTSSHTTWTSRLSQDAPSSTSSPTLPRRVSWRGRNWWSSRPLRVRRNCSHIATDQGGLFWRSEFRMVVPPFLSPSFSLSFPSLHRALPFLLPPFTASPLSPHPLPPPSKVLQDFPSTRAHIPFRYLFDLIPALQPRAFSIASSMTAHPHCIQILMAVVRYRSKLHRPRLVGGCGMLWVGGCGCGTLWVGLMCTLWVGLVGGCGIVGGACSYNCGNPDGASSFHDCLASLSHPQFSPPHSSSSHTPHSCCLSICPLGCVYHLAGFSGPRKT